jgi:hypothetical protein
VRRDGGVLRLLLLQCHHRLGPLLFCGEHWPGAALARLQQHLEHGQLLGGAGLEQNFRLAAGLWTGKPAQLGGVGILPVCKFISFAVKTLKLYFYRAKF